MADSRKRKSQHSSTMEGKQPFDSMKRRKQTVAAVADLASGEGPDPKPDIFTCTYSMSLEAIMGLCAGWIMHELEISRAACDRKTTRDDVDDILEIAFAYMQRVKLVTTVSAATVARLFCTCVLVACKFHDDDVEIPMSVWGKYLCVSGKQMLAMERKLFFTLLGGNAFIDEPILPSDP